MFIDNTKKIICLSVPGTNTNMIEKFLKSQSIPVTWFATGQPQQLTTQFNTTYINNNISLANDPEKIITDTNALVRNFENLDNNSNVDDLIQNNIIEFPINEYDIYGICIDPMLRVIQMFDMNRSKIIKKIYEDQLADFNKTIEEIKASTDNPDAVFPEPPPAPNIKENILFDLHAAFIEDIGYFAPERFRTRSKTYSPQIDWLKHQGQNINHIYKYGNYLNFVSDICARYNIDPALYNDTARSTCRTTDLAAEDISQEIKDKILEVYAEDKALYDSL